MADGRTRLRSIGSAWAHEPSSNTRRAAELIDEHAEELAQLESADSGQGRDRLLHALEAYAHLKTTWVAL
jgi:acyl-CoA reductase-like NAD-dependent aldehyde dehydrogenase